MSDLAGPMRETQRNSATNPIAKGIAMVDAERIRDPRILPGQSPSLTVTNPPGLGLDAVGRRWDEPTVSLRAMRALRRRWEPPGSGIASATPGSRRETIPGSRYTKSNGVRTLEALTRS
jgi:hypothetical protein